MQAQHIPYLLFHLRGFLQDGAGPKISDAEGTLDKYIGIESAAVAIVACPHPHNHVCQSRPSFFYMCHTFLFCSLGSNVVEVF